MARLRWGILSTAWIAGLVAPCIAGSDEAELVAVGSRDEARAGAFARQHGLAVAHGSYESLLGDDRIDAVYIAVPNTLHAAWTEAALQAGKHVLCEKPLTLVPEQASRLFQLARDRDLVLMEGFMYRHHPQLTRLEEAVAGEELGSVQSIHSSFFTRVGDTTNIRYNADLGGGALWDVGSYCVSLSNLLAGDEPVELAGHAQMGATGVDISFVGSMKYANGWGATFACGIEADLRTEAIVVGSDRAATLANPWLPDIPADIWYGPPPRTEIVLHHGTAVSSLAVTGTNPYLLEVDNFCRAVAGTEDQLIGAEETVANLRTLVALRVSAGLG